MSALVEMMAWRRTGDKPLSYPMMIHFTDAYMSCLAWMSYYGKGCGRRKCRLAAIAGAIILVLSCHFNDVLMARWRLKSPTSRLFTQPFIQAQIKESKHQSPASLAFGWPVKSPHKGPVTRKMFQFDDVIFDLQLKICHQNNSPSYDRQRDIPYSPSRKITNIWNTSPIHTPTWGPF